LVYGFVYAVFHCFGNEEIKEFFLLGEQFSGSEGSRDALREIVVVAGDVDQCSEVGSHVKVSFCFDEVFDIRGSV
jgi:hypothetical protein